MNFIALTGSDMPAMARAAEILLELVTEHRLQVAIALHVNDLAMVRAVKERAGPLCIGELWRIGEDDSHPRLNSLVDAHITHVQLHVDPTGFLYQRLLAFRQRLLAHQTFTHHQQRNLESFP